MGRLRALYWLAGLFAAALAVSSVLQFVAIMSLKGEMVRILTEHRADERDRYFELNQTVKLESTDTRDLVKDVCPVVPSRRTQSDN